MKSEQDITRKCGDCQECCILLSIHDEESGFEKEPVKPCEHLCQTGCSIYEKKPKVCSGFYCMWAVDHVPGMFRETDRPDKIGILVVMNNPESEFSKFAGLPSFTVYETRPNAFHEWHADKLLRRVFKKWLCILMPWKAREQKYVVSEGTQFRGPIHAIKAVQAFDQRSHDIASYFKERQNGIR